MRLVAVVGAARGIGKSRLCVSLVDWLTGAGLAVDHFAEEHDATARYLADAVAAGTAGPAAPAPGPGRHRTRRHLPA